MTSTPPMSVSAPSPPDGTADADVTGSAHPSERSRLGRSRRPLASGLLPGISVTVLTMAVLSHYGTPVKDMLVFGAYVLLCLALPGTLLIRALYGGARTRVEEFALGTALGYAIEILAYIAARALGAPLLVLLWPITTYLAFLAFPRLRGHWKGRARTRAPLWWPWFLTLTLVYLLGTSALTFFSGSALTWPAFGTARFDLPFSLALLGELKHHVPPEMPLVFGEGLQYHWFVYAHLAAASWITGVEPLVLLSRLGVLPMLAAFVILVGMVGRRVIGSHAGAALSVAGTLLVALPSLYTNANGLLLFTGVQYVPWTSPTTALGTMLFAPILLLLIDLLERRPAGIARWALLAVFLMAVMGGKAMYIPLALAGLVSVAAVELIRRRRVPWRALGAMGLVLACLGYSQMVLYGGARWGLGLDPLSISRRTWGRLMGLDDRLVLSVSSATVLGLTLLYLLGWALGWSGTLGLLRRLRHRPRPAVVLLLGMSAAGIGATLLLGSPGGALNQSYFYMGIVPCMAILSAYGYLVLARRERVPALAAGCAACAGVAIAHLIRVLYGVTVPLRPGEPDTALYLPYLALLAVVALAALAVVALPAPRWRPRPWALLIALAVGAGPIAAWQARVLLIVNHSADQDYYKNHHTRLDQVPRGALTAARWLRENSSPGDLIATNVHCRWGFQDPCDNRQFWLAALTERRVLVEGWGFTATNIDRWRPGELIEHRPFWDQRRLRLNDAVFHASSAAAVRRLRELYGVRWLVTDERYLTPGTRIENFAELRLRHGDYAIYRVPDDPKP